jgi:carbonic anhydrase
MTRNQLANTCSCCGDFFTSAFSRRRFLQGAAVIGLAQTLTPLAMAAEGHYDAMLLACIDPRFPQPTFNHMKDRGMVGKYSQFNFAGASIGAVAPAFKDWHETFWQNLAASIQLHHIPKVIALNHRDCGAAKIAYGADKVANREFETQTHRSALLEFAKQVKTRHPSMSVELGLMGLDGAVEVFS